MHSIWILLRVVLVPLMAGLLVASAVAPCQAFAPRNRPTAVRSFDPCDQKIPSPAAASCAQLACQVLLEPPIRTDGPILCEVGAALHATRGEAAGRTFRPEIPPPRPLL